MLIPKSSFKVVFINYRGCLKTLPFEKSMEPLLARKKSCFKIFSKFVPFFFSFPPHSLKRRYSKEKSFLNEFEVYTAYIMS